jgi:hypothetical protein
LTHKVVFPGVLKWIWIYQSPEKRDFQTKIVSFSRNWKALKHKCKGSGHNPLFLFTHKACPCKTCASGQRLLVFDGFPGKTLPPFAV